MADDWRLHVDLHEHGVTHALRERLEAAELEHDLAHSFTDRVVVSIDGPEVFCYAGSREQAERAEQLIRSLAAEHGWRVDCELKHWHPTAEEWEDPDTPLPQTDADRAAERIELMELEREESRQLGFPEFEVRVQCPSHHDTVELAETLRAEGVRVVERRNFLLLGVDDEDSASALAERMRGEAPPGSTVSTEGNLRAIYAERPANPFAVFGGLAG